VAPLQSRKQASSDGLAIMYDPLIEKVAHTILTLCHDDVLPSQSAVLVVVGREEVMDASKAPERGYDSHEGKKGNRRGMAGWPVEVHKLPSD
jgi:hypothetical protein